MASNLSAVERIKEEISKLPKDYQSLIIEEKNFAQKHPMGIALIGVAVGYVTHGLVSMAFSFVGALLF